MCKYSINKLVDIFKYCRQDGVDVDSKVKILAKDMSWFEREVMEAFVNANET